MTQPENASPFDPFGAWNRMRDTYMDAWSRAMVDLVNSDAYSQAMGTWLDNYLTMSAPFQRMLESTMAQALANLNMPSRADITALAERLTNIEMRLDDLEARLTEKSGE